MAKGDKQKAINKFVEQKRDVVVAKQAAMADGKVTKAERKDIRKEQKQFKEARKDLKEKYGKKAVEQAKEKYKKKYGPSSPISAAPINAATSEDVVSNSKLWSNGYIRELYGLGMEEIGATLKEQYAANLYKNFEAAMDTLIANNTIGEIDQIPTTLAISALYKDDDKRVDYDSLIALQDVDDIYTAPPRNLPENTFSQNYKFGVATPNGFVENQIKSNPDGSAAYDMKIQLPDINGVVDYRVDILEVQ